jgi:TolA-binding protein
MSRLPVALVFGLLLAPLPGRPAQAQVDSREGIALQNQISELRHDVQTLRDQIARGGSGGGGSALGGYRAGPAPAPAPSSDITAQLLDRVTALEDQVRQLHGRMDEADNARQRMNDDLTKQIGDLNFKIDQGSAAGGAAAKSPPPGQLASPGTPPAAPATPAPARRTPEVLMQQGNAALARRDYAAAEGAAREVLAGPSTPRSLDAQFLLAQALAGKKDYAQAAITYNDVYSRAHNGAHAADSLIGLANSLSALGEKKAACESLDKLRTEFPNPRGDQKEAAASARQRAGCR